MLACLLACGFYWLGDLMSLGTKDLSIGHGTGSMLSALSELRRGGKQQLPAKGDATGLHQHFENAGWSIGTVRPGSPRVQVTT